MCFEVLQVWFLIFVSIWVLICHSSIFLVLTIWVFQLSQFEFCEFCHNLSFVTIWYCWLVEIWFFFQKKISSNLFSVKNFWLKRIFVKKNKLWTKFLVSLNVRVSVCSLLRYCLNVFFPPLPKVGCPKNVKIRNPWGNVVGRTGLRFEHFCSKMVKNHRGKKWFYRFFFICSLLRYHLNVFVLPLIEVRCPIRDSESLGKSNGNKWSQNWTFVLKNGLKLQRWNFSLICSLHLNVFLPPLPKVQCPNFFNFPNPWGKLMKISGLIFEYFCS